MASMTTRGGSIHHQALVSESRWHRYILAGHIHLYEISLICIKGHTILVHSHLVLFNQMATTVESEASSHNHDFTMANLARVYHLTFAQGFSNNECQALARTLLRHQTHLDRTHYKCQTPGSLHPSYIGFNPPKLSEDRVLTKQALIKALLGDVFDAVCTVAQKSVPMFACFPLKSIFPNAS